MRHLTLALGLLIFASFVFADSPPDPQVENAEKLRQTEIQRAEAELQKSQQKLKEDKEVADNKLVKAYEDAIKRAMKRKDLDAANAFAEKKKAFQEGRATAASQPSTGPTTILPTAASRRKRFHGSLLGFNPRLPPHPASPGAGRLQL